MQVWKDCKTTRKAEEECLRATEPKEDVAAPALGSAIIEETTATAVVAGVRKGTNVLPAKRTATMVLRGRKRHRRKSAPVNPFQSPVKKLVLARAAQQCLGQPLAATGLEVAPCSPKHKDAHEAFELEIALPATPLGSAT